MTNPKINSYNSHNRIVKSLDRFHHLWIRFHPHRQSDCKSKTNLQYSPQFLNLSNNHCLQILIKFKKSYKKIHNKIIVNANKMRILFRINLVTISRQRRILITIYEKWLLIMMVVVHLVKIITTKMNYNYNNSSNNYITRWNHLRLLVLT